MEVLGSNYTALRSAAYAVYKQLSGVLNCEWWSQVVFEPRFVLRFMQYARSITNVELLNMEHRRRWTVSVVR